MRISGLDRQEKGRNRRKRLGRWVVGTVLVPLAICTLSLSFIDTPARWAWEREKEKIARGGGPLSMSDLTDAMPTRPDIAGSAEISDRISILFDKLRRSSPKESRAWFGEDGSVVPNTAGRVLSHYQDYLRLVREVLDTPRFRFRVEYSEGLAEKLPPGRQLAFAARLFACEADMLARDGRVVEALGRVEDTYRTSLLLDGGSRLVVESYRLSCIEWMLKALANVDARGSIPSGRRKEWLARLRGIVTDEAIARVLVAERAGVIDVCERMLSKIPNHRKFTRRLFYRDARRLVEIYGRQIEATRMPVWEALPEVSREDGSALASIEERPGPLSVILLVSAKPTLKYAGVVKARLDTAILGLSCELYKSRHGKYPDKLGRLAPEFLDKLPPDPFTGKPFVYKLKDAGKGFIVYSIGENLTDDGGVKKRSSGKDDIAWEGGQGGKKD
ncbi:MAG: hypothetical protein ACYSU0_11830 [Planctomycetota bacterium]